MKILLLLLILFFSQAYSDQIHTVLTQVMEYIGPVESVQLRLYGRLWRDAHDTILRSEVKSLLKEKGLSLELRGLNARSLFMLRELKYIRGAGGDWRLVIEAYLNWARQSGWRGFGDEEAVEKRRVIFRELGLL